MKESDTTIISICVQEAHLESFPYHPRNLLVAADFTVVQVLASLLGMGLQKEATGAALCEVAESLKESKLSDHASVSKSKCLLQKLTTLAEGNPQQTVAS